MNKITLRKFQRRTTPQAIAELLPLLVISQSGLTMLVTQQFAELPGTTRISRTRARQLSAAKWGELLERGPVVVAVFNSPWFKVELYEEV